MKSKSGGDWRCVLIETHNDVVQIHYALLTDGIRFHPVGRSLRTGKVRVLLTRAEQIVEAIKMLEREDA